MKTKIAKDFSYESGQAGESSAPSNKETLVSYPDFSHAVTVHMKLLTKRLFDEKVPSGW